MNIEEMKSKLDGAYNRLQTLDIVPSIFNMEKLVQSLYDLRDVYTELEKEGAVNGRSTADSQ